MKQKLKGLKGKIDMSTIIVGDFKPSLSTVDRTSKQKNQQGYRTQ